MTIIGRRAAALTIVLGLLLAVQLGTHAAYRIDRTLGGLSEEELSRIAAYLPGRLIHEHFQQASGDLRIRLPASWVVASATRPARQRLALFIDGRRVPIVIGAPDDSAPLPRAFQAALGGM